jgi:aromatic ring-cleaving dioxygenase
MYQFYFPIQTTLVPCFIDEKGRILKLNESLLVIEHIGNIHERNVYQGTNWKDKNGNEIIEGHILEHKYAFKVEIRRNKYDQLIPYSLSNRGFLDTLIYYLSDSEIIGHVGIKQ